MEIFNVKPNETYICKKCGEANFPIFHPLATKTWNKTSFLGFITTVIPILTINFFINNRWKAFFYGAVIAVLIYAFYLIFLIKTTKFKS